MPPGSPTGTPPAAPPPPKNNNRLWWILGLGGGGCVVLACIIGVVGVGFLSMLGRQVSTVFSTIESGLTITPIAGRPTLQVERPTFGPSATLPPATSGDGRVVSSSDGAIEIEVPNSWRTMDDLNAEADIQAANLILEQYAIVIREPKTTLPDGTTLEEYTQLVTQNIESTLIDANVPTPQETTVNGLPTLRIEATGKIDNIEAAYIITVVEGPDHFYNITAWTLLENLDRNRPVLEQVSDSFREVR
jgi:hypothetical protein